MRTRKNHGKSQKRKMKGGLWMFGLGKKPENSTQKNEKNPKYIQNETQVKSIIDRIQTLLNELKSQYQEPTQSPVQGEKQGPGLGQGQSPVQAPRQG